MADQPNKTGFVPNSRSSAVPSARGLKSVEGILTILLAGGAGERLAPLTRDQPKPMMPFGGIYRLIDLTLSNCLNSGLTKIYVLTQYKALSLNRHIRQVWNILSPELGQFIETVPPT